ncbi:MAG: LPS assembly lipoprotein LptE [Rhizobiaceae bacterium]
MSLREPIAVAPRRTSLARIAWTSVLLAGIAAVSACQVRPLYSSAETTAGVPGGVRADLSSIAIKPVRTRYGQEVRNHLIFLFNGGKGQPASPAFSMDLTVVPQSESSVLVASGDDNEPTAGTTTLIGTYTVTDFAKGKVLAAGTRRVTSAFDIPKQEFAALRAVRDAENRAARELAQVLQLAVAQEMANRQPD